MKLWLTVLIGLALVGASCGNLVAGDHEGPSPSVWAADTCAVLDPLLARRSASDGDVPLAEAVDAARRALEQVEPATGTGSFHDRLTDDLESKARDLADLEADDASAGELDAEWARLRDEFVATLRDRAADLPSDAAVELRDSCPALFATDS